jgi:hypothetical protein
MEPVIEYVQLHGGNHELLNQLLASTRNGSSSGQTGQSWSNTYEGAQLGTSGQSGRLNLAS